MLDGLKIAAHLHRTDFAVGPHRPSPSNKRTSQTDFGATAQIRILQSRLPQRIKRTLNDSPNELDSVVVKRNLRTRTRKTGIPSPTQRGKTGTTILQLHSD